MFQKNKNEHHLPHPISTSYPQKKDSPELPATRKKECLGIAKGNQSNLNQSTLGNFFLIAPQVSLQENFRFLDGCQREVS
jgi:hypothetical protein